MTRRGPLTATVLVLALALSGCGGGATSDASSPSPTPTSSSSPADASACKDVTTGLLASVQKYVDAYGAPLTGSTSSGTTGGGDTELRSSLQQAQSELASKGCDLPTFRTDFAAGLEKVTAKGPLARAVLLRLTASMTGTLSTTAQTIALKPGDDLARKLSALAPGSTARLAAGEYPLAQPLVLLAGITLRGAGRARTTVSSRAAGSAILVLTSGRVELRDLALVHAGKAPATVLVGGPSSSVVLTSTRISGGRATPGTAGQSQAGTGVSMTARQGDTKARGTTLQVTRSELSGNDAAGILLAGAHRASIRDATFRNNHQCGICFAGVSSGAARGSTFAGNTVGVAVFDKSAPLLAQDVFTDGQVGIQVAGSGAPQVRDVRVTGAKRAGFIYSDNGNGRIDGATCARTPYGIVVGPKAYPYVAKTDCQLAKGR